MALFPEGVNRANLARADSDSNAIHAPGPASIVDSPGLQGSIQQVLMENLGQFVQIDFLVGINTIVRRSGILYSAGRGYVVLYDESQQSFVLCDVFSAKFVTFYGRNAPPAGQSLGIMMVDAQGNLRPAAANDIQLDGVPAGTLHPIAPEATPRPGMGRAYPPAFRTLGE